MASSAGAEGSRASASEAAQPSKAPRQRPKTGPLFCKKNANTGVFAGAVAKRVRDAGDCEIYAVGALPCQNAIKSIELATKYLQQEEGYDGMELAFTVEKRILPQSVAPQTKRVEETAVMCLHVRPLPAAVVEEPEVMVAADSNPGVAAGLLRSLVQERGMGSMTAMGERALNQALKTLLITEVYLKEHLEGRLVAATPRLERFDDGANTRHRIVLSCFPVPPRDAASSKPPPQESSV